MVNSDPGTGGRTLKVDRSKLISASGGYDAIAAQLGGKQVSILTESVSSGSPDLDRAIGDFAEAWTEGLSVMLSDQAKIADGLRTAVRDYTGVDVDAAYVAQIETNGLDGV